MNMEDQISELKQLYGSGIMKIEEGGVLFFMIPAAPLPTGCTPDKADILLCPSTRDGYPSRLYFEKQISTAIQRNWNAQNVRIAEKNWWAISWKVNPNLTLAQMVAAHLGALR